MDVSVLVAHEIQLARRNGYWLGADAEETADVDDNLAAMEMVDRADFLVLGSVDRSTLEDFRSEFGVCQANVIYLTH